MTSSVKTAVGIDVTEVQVAAVLLGRAREGVTVLQAARVPLAPGTIVHGRVVDPTSLLAALRALRTQHGMRARHYALSLPLAGALARIIPLETADPQEIADHMRSEVGQYAAFSGRETVSDFRVLAPATSGSAGRILVMASDREAVNALAGTCHRAGIQTNVAEPAIAACARAFGAAKQDHMLLAVRKDGTLSLCVARRGVLDFIRTRTMVGSERESSRLYRWLTDEINAVIQFYSFERRDASAHWTVSIVDDDGGDIPVDDRHALEARVYADHVQYWTVANGMPHGITFEGNRAKLSFTAVGLAMRLLESEEHGPGMNLLPQEAGQAHEAKRRFLLAATVLAALVPAIVLAAGTLNYMTGRLRQHIGLAKQAELVEGGRPLAAAVDELAHVDQRITALEAELECLRRVSARRPQVDWYHLLADVKSAVPSVLCITELSLRGPSDIWIEGVSKSDEAVDVFLDMLNRSEHVGRASLLRKGHGNSDQTGIRYTIRCSPAQGKI